MSEAAAQKKAQRSNLNLRPSILASQPPTPRSVPAYPFTVISAHHADLAYLIFSKPAEVRPY